MLNNTDIDISERNRHLASAEIIDAILDGVQPSMNSIEGWNTLRDDLDNSQEPGLDALRQYVRSTIETHDNM